MKIKNRLFDIWQSLKESSQRFPITVGMSLLLFILLIYYNENLENLSNLQQDRFIRFNMIIGLGIGLSLVISLIGERFFPKDKTRKILAHMGGTIGLIFYYKYFLREVRGVTIIRYFGVLILLWILFFYIPRYKVKESYEKYVIKIFANFFVTLIYSLVLLFGIFIILFTVDSLFDVNIKGKYYYYVYLFVSLVFSIALFLSKLPEADERFFDYNYSNSLRVLLTYIIIPLISIYTIILYLYFAKVLIYWQWPKGLVSHLVIWYSALSIGIIVLISPIENTSRICKNFSKYFPKLILPILLMMFISIGQRINQYGITENRYFILALGIWVAGIMIYYALEKSNNIVVAISLSLLVFISILSPFNSFAVSKYSQNKRLESILNGTNMIEGGQVVKNPNLNKEAKREISNILEYFNTTHSLEDVKVLEQGFQLSDMERVFGFAYESIDKDYEEYFYIWRDRDQEIFNVKDYDYLAEVGSPVEEKIQIGRFVTFVSPEYRLKILDQGDLIIDQDLNEFILGLYGNSLDDKEDQRGKKGQEEMTFELENQEIKLKLLFNDISGRVNERGKLLIEHISYILFIKIK